MKTLLRQYLAWIMLIICLGVMPSLAQTDAIIALEADVTALETGNYYTVTLAIADVTDVWQVNVEIEYDSSLLYIVGRQSGSPLTASEFFGEHPSIIIRNSVSNNKIVYTQSLVSPAEPLSGGGVIATFQIYPLSAGMAQLRFTTVELTRITYQTLEDGSHDLQSSELIPVLPAFAQFTITGDTVPPPPESTATPTPSGNDPAFVGRGGDSAQPPLENVSLAPTPIPAPQSEVGLPILPIAIALLVIGSIGFIALIIWGRHR